MPFIPHTDTDIARMLQRAGISDISQLFDEIPVDLKIDGLEAIGPALSEAEIAQLMQQRARADGEPLCFMGAGAYEHYIPAAVWDIATRGEFYSAYTPYQAEASQGTLQVIYEFQTMIASLNGLDVSNASLYDGATAFAEACLMAVRANRKSKSKKILVSRLLSPVFRSVATTILQGQRIELVELPIRNGQTDIAALKNFVDEDFAAVAIQNPSFLGTLEDVDTLTDWAHEHGALVIGITNPMSLALLKAPGQWGTAGADIACGEGQPMGIPLSSGGPYVGYLVCRKAIMRQMPGRIVGRTVDIEGKPGFTLTLQAREQHIRRSKATSNICTNQGLIATAATIYMSLMGAEGLRQVAHSCNANTHMLVDALCALPGISQPFDTPLFHEGVVQLDRPVAGFLMELSRQGILGGYDLSADYPELGHALLVCATEQRSAADIASYVAAAGAALEVAV
ncbi:MAG: aminomethyl-transferring glycine dehydrogenase subunit GcvPA [Gammaproteobacteria bacterium]|nr:aminomethyl-transferring glycine dehydrogenase subunit GcvPA [Gammaproteobacteria bacterium]MCP4089207.1 aminomethyl-transferring glycine dehydrogenase subunit GcvPA [Gammaproteobacteria bacterium]MCP4276769.1 aminomethyl-transferring glycine dehydrogenase subunit GcvPA [Gammaproteobacteria bacterium]MCP4830612.1 aminomethyl-transferring glycine dehydrogenase subunit GcvPA [Gammaproteobacteria bacterium]MCP4928421.1 aminomethyl-transferring glycine dehydrogenase subunit GcvPA [Gammaproteobac